MYILKYFPYIILAIFSLKFLILFINQNIVALKDQIDVQKIEKGLLSIKDIQLNNINRFSNCCLEFLASNGYTDITKISSNSNSINFISKLSDNSTFIRCISNNTSDDKSIDNITLEDSKDELELLLGKMIQYSCNYGVLICNSNFSTNCIDFIDSNLNSSIKNNIKLIDGYTLSTYIRNSRKSSIISEDLS